MVKKSKKIRKGTKFQKEQTKKKKLSLLKKVKEIKLKKSQSLVKESTKSEDLIHRTKIKVIGIGGGGSSIVSEIASQMKKVTFVAANTDLQALRKLARGVKSFQFGQNLTHGLGTGMNKDLGERAAQNEKEKIKELLSGQDLCILIACLGGGVGSGAAPIFAKISHSLGNITYGIFTLPFKFEGEKKIQIAKESLENLKPHLNAITIIPNEKIFQIIDKKTPLKAALSTINKNLAQALRGLIEMIYEPGLINIDFADLKAIFEKRGGLTYLNTTEAEGANRAEEIIKKVLSCPLYPYSIRGAKGVLFNIIGEKNLGLTEISKISENIHNSINKEAKIIFGVSQRKKYQNKIKITLLATGCGARIFSVPLAGKKKVKKQSKKQTEKRNQPLPKKEKNEKTLKNKIKREKPELPKRKERKKSQKIKSEKKESPPPQPKATDEKKIEVKIRKNALQIKKEIEETEKEMLEREKIWETPAFLRRKIPSKDDI